MLVAALFVKAKNQKQSRCHSSLGECLNYGAYIWNTTQQQKETIDTLNSDKSLRNYAK